MKLEGQPVSKESLADLIKSSIIKNGISLNESDKDVITELVMKFPSKPSNMNVSRWCNHMVSEKIAKYPDRIKDAEIIRNEVGKELRYMLDKDKFDDISFKIKEAGLTTITPQYFVDYSEWFANHIYRFYKNLEGEVDYSFLESKLGVKIEPERVRTFGNKEKVVASLVETLEKENPPIFNRDWVMAQFKSPTSVLGGRFPVGNNTQKIDWKDFQESLPEPWRNKFELPNRPQWIMLSLAKKVINFFDIKKDKKLSPSWIKKAFPVEYQMLVRHLPRDNHNYPRWQPFLDLLPQEILEKWQRYNRTKELLPESEYESESEVESKIGSLKEVYYLFYKDSKSALEKTQFSELLNKLIDLSKKGNRAAYEKLTDHLFFTIEDFIERESGLSIWKNASNEIKNIMRSCIYLYDPQKGDFLGYLFKSIRMKTPGIITIAKKGEPKNRKISSRGDIYDLED